MRVLVVSENESLISNINEWFKSKINNGDLVVDYVKTKDEAVGLLRTVPYDKIFQNGVYIIDAIEEYQSGVDVIQEGIWKNKIYKHSVTGHDKKELDKILRNKPLYFRGSMSAVITTVVTLLFFISSVIVYANSMRKDVNVNIKSIEYIKEEVKEVKDVVNSIDKSLIRIETAINVSDNKKEKKNK